jgi:SAM-dependent methyltransferase
MDTDAFEQKYVNDTYTKIAREFDITRNKVWHEVSTFLDSFDVTAKLADIGCGNGKNMVKPNMIGVDNCQEFVEICTKKNLDVRHGSVLDIPLDDDMFDGVICIAVIHHLSTEERRKQAVQELVRITKPRGQVLITVWAEIGYKSSKNVETISGTDKLVGWKNESQRYYHLFTEGELEKLVREFHVSIVKSGYEMKNWWICLAKN